VERSSFCVSHLTKSEIATVFDEDWAAEWYGQNRQLARVIAVYASKGGCGTTFCDGEPGGESGPPDSQDGACVVDLNLQAGDQPLYLGARAELLDSRRGSKLRSSR
jgi:hypothetical protein